MLSLFTSIVLALGVASRVVGSENISSRTDCPDPCAAFNPVPFYRAFYKSGTDHFYTRSLPEVVSAASRYQREQDAGRVLAANQTGAVPLFRLYNANLVDHFYTTDPNERAGVLAGGGWVDEGIAAYVLQQPQCGAIPLYRTFTNDGFDHFYTTDTAEMTRAVTGVGYVFEATIGFIWSALD